MSGVTAAVSLVEAAGHWKIWARRPGYAPVDVSWVRGVPTEVSSLDDSDPFGWTQAVLRFPAVTMFDTFGSGELYWLAPEVDFDIEWVGPVPAAYPFTEFRFEGYSEPFDYEMVGHGVTLKGAMHQMDNYLAKPEYAAQPFPYEVAIDRCWRDKADLRLKQLRIDWPSWWSTVYVPKAKQLGHLIPTGVVEGAKWTGLLTRETGSWDPTLSSYIQTMLASMYTQRGRWTLDLEPGRRPVLKHRDFKFEPDDTTIILSALQPGMKPSLKEDYSQSANVFYGQSKALSGEAYTGMQVIGDGQATVYKPLAALRQVEPVTDRNTWLEPGRMRREQMLQVQEGLDANDTVKVGQAHLAYFSDPGVVGSIELTSDVVLGSGEAMSRFLIKAGMSVLLKHFKGNPDGTLFHIASVSRDLKSGSVSLTVDTKHRDKLTLDEIEIRGRDAMAVPRMLIGGKYAPPVPDLLFPWSYAEGSGYIPSSPTYNARRLFDGMPTDIMFPWTEWTTQRPPSDRAWRSSYIRIGPKSADPDNNWAFAANRGGAKFGIPIKMGAAGDIRMIQLAAYDADGNVLAVPFHVSIYYQRGVNKNAMPKIPAELAPVDGYPAGKHYPFFPQAWETYRIDGTQWGTEVPVNVQSAGLIQGWGTSEMRAGHWPGSSGAGDPPTGLLVDETVWNWNLIGVNDYIGPYKVNDVSPYAGYLYAMIYCDAQEEDEVFFMGRMYRVEPGSAA